MLYAIDIYNKVCYNERVSFLNLRILKGGDTVMKQLAVLMLSLMLAIAAPQGAADTDSVKLVILPGEAGAYIEVTSPTEATVETALKTEPTTVATVETRITEPVVEPTVEATEPTETTEATEPSSEETTPTENASINQGDLELLARLIYVEAGCEWYPDWVKKYVGYVVLNRVNSDIYPNTIEGVIYDPGQYEPQYLYREDPDDCAMEIAREVLKNGCPNDIPSNMFGQNSTGEGEVYTTYYDSILNETIYFTCL